MSKLVPLVLVASFLPTAVAAQQRLPAFKNAFVSPSVGGEPSINMPGRPPGVIGMRNVALRDIIVYAFDIPPSRLVNAPDWVSERFDIAAKRPDDAWPNQDRVMLQRLLEERFQLRVHRGMQQQPSVDVLVIDSVQRPPQNPSSLP